MLNAIKSNDHARPSQLDDPLDPETLKRTCLIAAMDENRSIGYNNRLPWHLSEDLRFFKKTTQGHCIIMGRTTFESFGRKPLPGRENIVLSRNYKQLRQQYSHDHLAFVGSNEEALKLASQHEKIFIIGGAEIYQQWIKQVKTMILTHVKGTFNSDTHFPEFEQDWKESNTLKDCWNDAVLGWKVVQYSPQT